MRTIAIANQKGGVGKTATAAALGASLSASGYRVLLIDLDPQGSLSHGLGIDAPGRSMAEVIGGAERGTLTVRQIVKPLAKNLDLAPSDIALATAEIYLPGRMAREHILKQSLEPLTYDVCIIDCPPALGLLTVNALTAASSVIVPTLPAAADLRGVNLFMGTVANVKQINPALQLLGVVIVQYDERLNSHRDSRNELQRAKLPILGTIPRSVRVQESAAAGQSIIDFDPGGKPSTAYNQLTRKVIQWLKRK